MVRPDLLDKQLGYLAFYSNAMKRPEQVTTPEQSSANRYLDPMTIFPRSGSLTPPPQGRLGTAMAAAALQQHLSLSLGLSTRPRGPRRRAPPKPDQEYVLDAAPPAPTLAQRYGLATPPPSQLTEQDWARVKETSNRRGDSSAPCVICKEEFTQFAGQVLLSCSHVFHKVTQEFFIPSLSQFPHWCKRIPIFRRVWQRLRSSVARKRVRCAGVTSTRRE